MVTEPTAGSGAAVADAPDTGPLAVITSAGGLRFAADVRGHRVQTDQPLHAGGDDSAVMPLDLLGVALGTCVALYAHQFCQARGIPQPDMSVEVRWQKAKAPSRVGRFDVRVILPDELPGEYRTALERAVRACPVHNTLTHPPEIGVELIELARD